MNRSLKNTLFLLLTSRKFLLAVLAVVQTVVLHYVNVPQDIWLAIDGLLVTVIGTIALEDAAEKLRSVRVDGSLLEVEAPPSGEASKLPF